MGRTGSSGEGGGGDEVEPALGQPSATTTIRCRGREERGRLLVKVPEQRQAEGPAAATDEKSTRR
jgi:hypothetical protein